MYEIRRRRWWGCARKQSSTAAHVIVQYALPLENSKYDTNKNTQTDNNNNQNVKIATHKVLLSVSVQFHSRNTHTHTKYDRLKRNQCVISMRAMSNKYFIYVIYIVRAQHVNAQTLVCVSMQFELNCGSIVLAPTEIPLMLFFFLHQLFFKFCLCIVGNYYFINGNYFIILIQLLKFGF